MTARMILIGVKFEGADVNIPGLGNIDQLPDKASGWTGKLEGYSMRVVGERLEIWCPAGIAQTDNAKAELTANGIDHGEALSMVSISLHRCTLRYVGITNAAYTDLGETGSGGGLLCAPSQALRKPKPPEVKAQPPANTNAPAAKAPPQAVVKVPAKTPQPTPRSPAPTPRKPPGARGPSKETGIVRDLSAAEIEARDADVEKRAVGLAVEHVAGAAEAEE